MVDSRGNSDEGEVYDDMNADQIETLSPTAPHRHVDLEIVKADKEGYVKTYIVLPPVIYGLAKTRFVDAGIQNPRSIMIPTLIKLALARGEAGMIGHGKNVWDNVEIHERMCFFFGSWWIPVPDCKSSQVADVFVLLYEAILEGKNTALGHGREGYYFASNGVHPTYSITKAIGSALVKLGKIKSAEPTSFAQEEVDKYFGPFVSLVLYCTQQDMNILTSAL